MAKSIIKKDEENIERDIVQSIFDSTNCLEKYDLLKKYIKSLKHATNDKKAKLLVGLEAKQDSCDKMDKFASDIMLAGLGHSVVKTGETIGESKFDLEYKKIMSKLI